MAAIYSRLH